MVNSWFDSDFWAIDWKYSYSAVFQSPLEVQFPWIIDLSLGTSPSCLPSFLSPRSSSLPLFRGVARYDDCACRFVSTAFKLLAWRLGFKKYIRSLELVHYNLQSKLYTQSKLKCVASLRPHGVLDLFAYNLYSLYSLKAGYIMQLYV